MTKNWCQVTSQSYQQCWTHCDWEEAATSGSRSRRTRYLSPVPANRSAVVAFLCCLCFKKLKGNPSIVCTEFKVRIERGQLTSKSKNGASHFRQDSSNRWAFDEKIFIWEISEGWKEYLVLSAALYVWERDGPDEPFPDGVAIILRIMKNKRSSSALNSNLF